MKRQLSPDGSTDHSTPQTRAMPRSTTIEGSPGLEPALPLPLPLPAAGVVLRRRSGESDESTIKLRPCRRTQLTPEWANRVECGRMPSLRRFHKLRTTCLHVV